MTSAIAESKVDADTPLTAIGARLSPITATIAPVTTGGISASIQRVPTADTIAPSATYTTPHAMMPPSATGMFGFGPLPA